MQRQGPLWSSYPPFLSSDSVSWSDTYLRIWFNWLFALLTIVRKDPIIAGDAVEMIILKYVLLPKKGCRAVLAFKLSTCHFCLVLCRRKWFLNIKQSFISNDKSFIKCGSSTWIYILLGKIPKFTNLESCLQLWWFRKGYSSLLAFLLYAFLLELKSAELWNKNLFFHHVLM